MESEQQLSATLRALLLFDIAEEIDLSRLHTIMGTSPSKREPAFRHPAPEYVRYERSPVVEQLEPMETNSHHLLSGRIRYFEYGVASVELRLEFQGTWESLIQFAHRWISSAELEGRVHELLRQRMQRIGPALSKSYEGWITEDYYVIQVNPILRNGVAVTAEELIQHRGVEIAQIVRGDECPLSTGERQEVLQSSMSYYPSDLLVVGWVAAFVYDQANAASPTIDLLEYANTQLLEFRYYDEVLTRVLAEVYKQLEQKRGFWSRWKLAQEAQNLNTIRLDCRELTERTDNAIKFLSDMFYARAYRLAAARIGVTDYRNLVNEKLTTAEDLYDSMVTEFHQGRAFVLELLVVIILIIEIALVFRGKS